MITRIIIVLGLLIYSLWQFQPEPIEIMGYDMVRPEPQFPRSSTTFSTLNSTTTTLAGPLCFTTSGATTATITTIGGGGGGGTTGRLK
jgi:hypothetical protein